VLILCCSTFLLIGDCVLLLWPCIVNADIIFSSCGFFFFLLLFLFLAWSQQSHSGCLPYFYTWCGLSADLKCRSEMCCTWLTGNTGRKNHHLRTIAQLCQAISLQLRCVLTVRKSLLSSNMSSRCPHNIVNFGPLTAEIGSGVWGTPANFNRFCVLASLLHGSQVVSVSQTLRHWTEGATYVPQGDHHVGHWPTF